MTADALAGVHAFLGEQARGRELLGARVCALCARLEPLGQLLHLREVPLHLGHALVVLQRAGIEHNCLIQYQSVQLFDHLQEINL